MAPAVLRSSTAERKPEDGEERHDRSKAEHHSLGVGVGKACDGKPVRPEDRLSDEEHAERGEEPEHEDDAADEDELGEEHPAPGRRRDERQPDHPAGVFAAHRKHAEDRVNDEREDVAHHRDGDRVEVRRPTGLRAADGHRHNRRRCDREKDAQAEGNVRGAERRQLGPLGREDVPETRCVLWGRYTAGAGSKSAVAVVMTDSPFRRACASSLLWRQAPGSTPGIPGCSASIP